MRAGAVLGGLVLLLALVAGARAGVPAVAVSTDLSPSVAHDIDEWSRIYIEGPDALDEWPLGQILLPPHPGGGELSLPCSELLACFHEHDVPGGFAESGRIIGRVVGFGSGGPFIAVPATWSAAGTTRTLITTIDGHYTAWGHVAHGNSGDLLVGILPFLGAVYWSGPAEEPVELADAGNPERVNDAGEIVGSTEGSGERAAIWKPPGYALEFLGELAGGTTSRAHDLDSSGLVVGSSDDGSGDVAVVWAPNGSGYDAIPLPVPAGFAGGSCTEATAISDAGRIAGNCTTAGGQTLGVIWRKQGASWAFLRELDPFLGDTESAVFGLNESGQAVGRSGDDATGRAVLWNFAFPQVPATSALALVLLGLGMLWTGRRALSRPTLRVS